MHKPNQDGIADEHPRAHLIQASCGVIFFLIWLLDLILIQLPLGITNIVQFLFRIILFVSSLILALKFGLSSHNRLFGDRNGPSGLLSDDVFAVVRHPMYFSTLLFYLGLIFLSFSLISVFPWLITFILYNKIAVYEEKELERLLGDEYYEYQKKVPRWIPKLSSIIKLLFRSS